MISEPEAAARQALEATYPQADKRLRQYVDILSQRGLAWGLMGPREGERLWSRHIANSLALDSVIPTGVSLADVGSGAGLPGLPLAIVRPDLKVTLVEPLLRRTTFLELAVEELGLTDQVSILRSRAEDVHERFDVVTCRAVAPLVRLLKWTMPLFTPDGTLVALKGDSAQQEIEDAGRVLTASRLSADVLELRAAPSAQSTRAIRVSRLK